MYTLEDFSNAEKIATIMSCRKSGPFGKFVSVSNGWSRVELVNDQDATYMCVLVKADRIGWTVEFCGIEFTDADLEVAAEMAADWQKANKGKAIATRNVRVPLKPVRQKKARRQAKKS